MPATRGPRGKPSRQELARRLRENLRRRKGRPRPAPQGADRKPQAPARDAAPPRQEPDQEP